LRIAANWDLAYIAAPLVGFRVHGGSVTAAAIRATGLADGSEALLRVRSRALAEQRNLFLDEASLELSLRAELRSLARLQILIDDAYLGLSSREVAQGLMETVRVSPRILRSRFFWRLVAAQMGGRKARSALSAASRSVCGMLGWRRTGLSRSSESQLPGEPQK
jgi:hypothetical protein